MEVYLLRHGIAEEGRSGLSDADRALTQDGRRKLRRTLDALSEADVQISLMLTSPLKRAVQTAEIAQEALGYKGKLVRTQALSPNSRVEDVWQEIRSHRDESALMLVGHNPLFDALGGYLLGARDVQIDMKKGSIVRIDFEHFPPHPRGILRWLLIPKLVTGTS
ncbi:MAG: phosphohistidine phosphatase SixA [Acidobacteriaceae bacterium]|nr:phosphohistidine phosphatase SixA [Acidobacteriaceae bacterium]MBV9781092.1 phosphohistidine phosphatase SixA [Acidobacteriaceae bacterium]